MTVAKLMWAALALSFFAACTVLSACAGGARGCQTSADCAEGTVCVNGHCTVTHPSLPDSGPDTDRDTDTADDCLNDPHLCDDKVDCTVDACQTDASCIHMAAHEMCGAGKLCSPTDGCIDAPTCEGNAGCNDDDPCNGVEHCVDSRCEPGEVPSCDDHDPCTLDSCEASAGDAEGATGCAHAPIDDDRDGHTKESCDGDDCDDAHASVYPEAPELCDGLDQDCDGEIDEALACVPGEASECTTVCGSSGTRMCTDSCSWDTCEPPFESCNGVDDDCDGSVDDGFLCPQGLEIDCATTCGSTGQRVCTDACSWDACVPPTETCNGIDDDCDGACDDAEGFACCLGARNIPCTTTCGTAGLGECVGGCQIDCRSTEACNGCDDDGDLEIDEGGVCDGETCLQPLLINTPSTIITRSTCGRMNDDSPSVANCGAGYGNATPDMVLLVVPPSTSTVVRFTLVSAAFDVQWAITRESCNTNTTTSHCWADSESLSGYTHYFVHVSGHSSPDSCGTFTMAVTW